MADAISTAPFSCEGGWITAMDALKQGKEAPGSAAVLQNFEPHPAGGYRRVQGYTKFDAAAVPGTGDILGVCALSTLSGVIACRGADVYTSAGSGWTKRNGANTRSTVAYNRFALYGYMGNERVVMCNGADAPVAFDPLTFTYTVLTNAPSAATCAVEFRGSMWYGKGNLLTYSAPYAENDFTPANGAGVVNVGTPITGLVVWRDQLIIFGAGAILKVVGNSDADYRMSPVTANMGCPWPETIQEINGDIVYLAHDGLRTVAGTTNIGDLELASISKQIQDDITALARTYTRLTACAIRKKSQYRLLTSTPASPASATTGVIGAIRVGSSGNAGWEYGTLKGIKATVCSSTIIAGTERELAVFGNDSGYIYQMESGNTFDGEAIQAIYQTPFLVFDDPRIRKVFRKLQAYVDAEGAFKISLSLLLDLNGANVLQPLAESIDGSGGSSFLFGTLGTTFGTATFGTTSTLPMTETNLIGAGFNGSFRFAVTEACPPFSIKTLTCELSLGGRR